MNSSSQANEYVPIQVDPPGEILQEALDERNMTQAQLAERMGRPKKTVNEIIKGKAAITPETALQLERVLGITSGFWNNLEKNYRETCARAEERDRLSRNLQWLKEIPIRFLIKEGWINDRMDKIDLLREVLAFFGIASPDQWQKVVTEPQAAFRRSSKFEIDEGAIAAWLRKGYIEALKIKCKPFKEEKFRKILNEIRMLTREKEPSKFFIDATALCAEAGVALVLVKATPKSRVSGVARWQNKDKAIIQLSARGLSDDQLWFTFFHEAGHILLHNKEDVFLDGKEYVGEKEEEANRFAADLLIPPGAFNRITSAQLTPNIIRAFSESIGIAPGIVVGRLQKEGVIGYGGILETLKVHYKWAGTE